MSRELPPRPNLEHLKKHAKELLRILRQQRPDATLSEAQYALARHYGFANWTKLKQHIDALPAQAAGGGKGGGNAVAIGSADPQRGKPLFGRFTTSAREALFFARFEAKELRRLTITPDHLLLGVIRAARGALHDAFTSAGVTLESARAQIGPADSGREIIEPVDIPFEATAKAAFEAAAAEADRRGDEPITLAHLALALVQSRPDAVAPSFLRECGITADRLQQVAHDPGDLA